MNSPRDESDRDLANRREIEQAIHSLDDAAWRRVFRAACFAVRSHDQDEVTCAIQEAVALLLEGRWNWNRREYERFEWCLSDVVRGLAWNARDAAKRRPRSVPLESVELADSARVGVEQRLIQSEATNERSDLVAYLQRRFDADPLVLRIMDGFWDGLKPRQIQERFGLTRTEYETAVKRLRREAARAMGGKRKERR